MGIDDKLPAPYEEVLIWWNSGSGLQRRIARLAHDKKHFQLATFMADTKGQYLAPVAQVERWESIVDASAHEQLVAALTEALATIDDYLAYEHDGDPWKEDARAMGEMDIDDYSRDGRLEKARAALAAAGAA